MANKIELNRKDVAGFINKIDEIVNQVDEVMKEKESVDRGNKIAKLMNALNYQTQLAKMTLLKMATKDLSKPAK